MFVCFVALRSKSTAMVIAGTVSSPNHTFSWAGLNKRITSNSCTYFCLNWHQPFLNESAEGRKMTVEIISWSISTKVWDRAGIELATPEIAVRHASVARHVTDCATRPSFQPNGLDYPYQKNEPISNFRGVRWYSYFFPPNCNITFIKQIVKILIRHHIMQCLHCFYVP